MLGNIRDVKLIGAWESINISKTRESKKGKFDFKNKI
jgi:hypothetical protein